MLCSTVLPETFFDGVDFRTLFILVTSRIIMKFIRRISFCSGVSCSMTIDKSPRHLFLNILGFCFRASVIFPLARLWQRWVLFYVFHYLFAGAKLRKTSCQHPTDHFSQKLERLGCDSRSFPISLLHRSAHFTQKWYFTFLFHCYFCLKCDKSGSKRQKPGRG